MYSDGTQQDFGKFGFRVRVVDIDGQQVDEEWIPINGDFNIQKFKRDGD